MRKTEAQTYTEGKLHLNTFGNPLFRVQSCDLVRFQLRKPGGLERIEIIAYTSLVICTPLPRLVDVRQYKHLHGLEIADSGPEDQTKIDVLLGSDCYWSVVTDQLLQVRRLLGIKDLLL